MGIACFPMKFHIVSAQIVPNPSVNVSSSSVTQMDLFEHFLPLKPLDYDHFPY